MVTLWAALAAPWQVCLQQAWAAYRAGSLPIGAAVADRDDHIVGRGRNRIFENLAERPEDGCLFGHRLAHAEMNALVSVDHAAVNVRACVLYTTLEPCALCVGAIRMLGLKDVRFAACDTSAGSLALLDATDFMRHGHVQAQHLQQPELEAVLIAMNTDALLSIGERFDLRPPLDRWEAAGLPGVAFGRHLFASGELRRLASNPGLGIDPVLETLVGSYRDRDASTPAQATRVATPAHLGLDTTQQAERRPLVLIITGAPASGKTTLGRQVAAALNLPYLSKDLFKETLFESLGWSDRDWSRRLGGASMALLFRSAQALLEAGQSVALESNFYAAWDTPQLLALGERFRCRFVQVVCTAPGPTLAERFEQRERSGERHPGHGGAAALDEILPRLVAECWDALELEGPVFTVDTSNGTVDIDGLVRSISLVAGRPDPPTPTPSR